MKVSEITLPILKQYLRLDDNTEDDLLLSAYLEGAKEYVTSYTGLTIDELDNYPTLSIVILAIIADNYEVRQYTCTSVQQNPLITQMLGMYCKNFLEEQ